MAQLVSRRDAVYYSTGLILAGAVPRALWASEPSRAVPTLTRAPALLCRPTHDNIEGPYYRAGAPERFLLRGRVRTDDKGIYRVRTIVPGRYLNGRQYRSAHVHVKLRAVGFFPLTTQLYVPAIPTTRSILLRSTHLGERSGLAGAGAGNAARREVTGETEARRRKSHEKVAVRSRDAVQDGAGATHGPHVTAVAAPDSGQVLGRAAWL